MTKKEAKQEAKQEAIEMLRELIDPKKGIVIVQKSVSKSGMTRRVNVYSHCLSSMLNYNIDKAGIAKMDKNGEIVLSGCGMDMHFWLADNITYVIYSDKEAKKLKGNGSGCLPWRSL